jgi:predicted dinucleotide-binding enzyme
MNIGIIGSGGMGSCLASKFIKLGHIVSIANSRGPASLEQLSEDIGAEAGTVEEVHSIAFILRSRWASIVNMCCTNFKY